MRVMVVGSGAREHALAAKLAQSSEVDRVLCAPGNAGTSGVAENLAIKPDDVDALVAVARERAVELVVVGPEAPLVAGLVDALEDAGIPAFGPRRAAARLEGSKVFAKQLMARYGVPTAGFEVFEDADAADAYVRRVGRPWVVKADGLAAGKGVIVASSVDETLEGIDRIMRHREFGDAGARVVLEDRLDGEEVSFHVICDGSHAVALAAAQDHKRLLDGDQGPNTGGMGAYSPPAIVDDAMHAEIVSTVVEPTLQGLQQEGIPMRGALFIGLMIADGKPWVLEYNVRFGDPECQVLLSRWQGDVLPLLQGAATGALADAQTRWEAPASLCVVLASEGYPGSYPKGRVIRGLREAAGLEGVEIFHAGTASRDGEIVTSGGRVLSVTARGDDVDQAAQRAYAAADRIHFEGMQLRRDIGWRARR